jgi:hypothetical protein
VILASVAPDMSRARLAVFALARHHRSRSSKVVAAR